jgi:hydroxypyruvate reductase
MQPAHHLAANDSSPLLRATGDLLLTGPTGGNVADLILVFVFE